jgi:cytochrome c oxidase cbb3-type subunit 3
MNEKTSKQQPKSTKPTAVQTTGHAWDGDLQEFNNPLPRWWLWAFYGTVVFALLYWLLYPSWPFGNSYLPGLKTVSYTVDGETQKTHWNTRAALLNDLKKSDAAVRQQKFMQTIAAAEFESIANDPEMLAFARSVGKGLFGDNCAACHGRGGQGVMSLYPNLADDAWLWGGSMEKIEETLILGRNGFMPPFAETFDAEQLSDVAEYVLTLSGEAQPSAASQRGETLFQGFGGGCYYCHGNDAKGRPSQGAANLTDKIWTIVDVPGQKTLQEKKTALATMIAQGVVNKRVMPAWPSRLTPNEIKVLAVYVHQLGGGQSSPDQNKALSSNTATPLR